jgi:hypothetical protein
MFIITSILLADTLQKKFEATGCDFTQYTGDLFYRIQVYKRKLHISLYKNLLLHPILPNF